MAVITNHITNPAGAPSATASLAAAEAVEFAVTFPTLPPGAHHLDGRLLLLIAPAGSASEPRFMVSSDGLDTAQVFGRDVDAWLPDVPAVIGGSAVCNGAPLRSVAELPAGTYDCQCVLHLYVSCNYDIICFLNLQLIVIFIGTTAANQVMQAVLPFIVLGVNIAKERSKYRSALKTTTKYLEESNDSLDDQDRLDELSASGGRLGAFATAKTEVDKYELEVRNCLGIKKHTFAWCHFKSC